MLHSRCPDPCQGGRVAGVERAWRIKYQHPTITVYLLRGLLQRFAFAPGCTRAAAGLASAPGKLIRAEHFRTGHLQLRDVVRAVLTFASLCVVHHVVRNLPKGWRRANKLLGTTCLGFAIVC